MHIRNGRRAIAVPVVAALCATLAACGSSSGGSASGGGGGGGGQSAKGKKVVALLAGTNVPYLATYAKEMKQDAAASGLSLQVQSADFDASRQAQQFDDAISGKPDAIIINAVDAKAIVPSLLKAKQANIPVVASNNGVDPSAKSMVKGYTGPNDTIEGAMSAEIMAKAVGGKGNVAIVMGALGTTPQINRTKGFTDRLRQVAPNVKILGQETGNWDKGKSRTVAANFITRFGSKLNGIFGEDDTTASGAAQAVADAGKRGQIKAVGLGGSTLGFQGVKNGSISGTLIQSPRQDAKLAIEAAAKVVQGQSIPANTYLKPVKVTKANVGKLKPEW